ncbi:hypothetical protein GIB67_021285 [Kingdonia uniflora]|uniref:Uncharacterized protein n=1 Tax=Kingdonia uniflora TaxID=39325 RepID=A0A7J7LG01_9MAGN|nr:hypothetical protein GIB67_021285 [Kingdonia uniflora]
MVAYSQPSTSSLEVHFVSYSNILKNISTHNQAPQGTLIVKASTVDKPLRTDQHIIADKPLRMDQHIIADTLQLNV